MTSCVTRGIVNIRMAWSLQRGKTEGTKSIVSKVIYGRRGVYQFASGRCERAWKRARTTTILPRYLHHVPSSPLSLSLALAQPTSRTSTSRHSRTNDHYLLRPLPLPLSLHLPIPQTAFDYLSIREKEGKDETSSLGYLPLKLPLLVGTRSAKRAAEPGEPTRKSISA